MLRRPDPRASVRLRPRLASGSYSSAHARSASLHARGSKSRQATSSISISPALAGRSEFPFRRSTSSGGSSRRSRSSSRRSTRSAPRSSGRSAARGRCARGARAGLPRRARAAGSVGRAGRGPARAHPRRAWTQRSPKRRVAEHPAHRHDVSSEDALCPLRVSLRCVLSSSVEPQRGSHTSSLLAPSLPLARSASALSGAYLVGSTRRRLQTSRRRGPARAGVKRGRPSGAGRARVARPRRSSDSFRRMRLVRTTAISSGCWCGLRRSGGRRSRSCRAHRRESTRACLERVLGGAISPASRAFAPVGRSSLFVGAPDREVAERALLRTLVSRAHRRSCHPTLGRFGRGSGAAWRCRWSRSSCRGACAPPSARRRRGSAVGSRPSAQARRERARRSSTSSARELVADVDPRALVLAYEAARGVGRTCGRAPRRECEGRHGLAQTVSQPRRRRHRELPDVRRVRRLTRAQYDAAVAEPTSWRSSRPRLSSRPWRRDRR